MDNALVTILITSKDRPVDLRMTLSSLREQTYAPLEIIVIDDGSSECFQSILGAEFPEADFRRHDKSIGLIASRSEGFQLSRGRFMVSLDDDSNFCHPDAIELAVARMEKEQDIGLLAFRILNTGADINLKALPPQRAYYCHSYVGCGHMFRHDATLQVGGYMDFYLYGGEEEEYGLRALDAGWKLLYFPEVVVRHRVSGVGRSRGKMLGYTFRNMIWTLFLRMPLPYALMHACRKSVAFSVNLLAEDEFSWFWWGMRETARGLPFVFRQRRPVKLATFWLWHLLRRKDIITPRQFETSRAASTGRAVSQLIKSLFRRSAPHPTTV